MKLTEDVSRALSGVEINYPGIVRMPKLDRGVYLQVNKALEGMHMFKARELFRASGFPNSADRNILGSRVQRARTSPTSTR